MYFNKNFFTAMGLFMVGVQKRKKDSNTFL